MAKPKADPEPEQAQPEAPTSGPPPTEDSLTPIFDGLLAERLREQAQ